MLKFIPLLIFFFLNILYASVSPIDVQSVKFDNVKVGKYDWIQIEVKTIAPASSSFKIPDQQNTRFLDNIEMTLSLCYDNREQKSKDFYQSTIKIISKEKGDACYAYFYIPGIVVERDRLSKNPFAWMVEFSLSGNKIPNDPKRFKNNFSPILDSTADIESFLSNLDLGIEKNEGVLLPFYLAPDSLRRSERYSDKLLQCYHLYPSVE